MTNVQLISYARYDTYTAIHISTQKCAFKRQGSYKYVLCCRGYVELVVAIFENQIQLEYYDGNISLYIEVI